MARDYDERRKEAQSEAYKSEDRRTYRKHLDSMNARYEASQRLMKHEWRQRDRADDIAQIDRAIENTRNLLDGDAPGPSSAAAGHAGSSEAVQARLRILEAKVQAAEAASNPALSIEDRQFCGSLFEAQAVAMEIKLAHKEGREIGPVSFEPVEKLEQRLQHLNEQTKAGAVRRDPGFHHQCEQLSGES